MNEIKWGAVFWRFATGNHLDGRPRTNASWRRKGTMPKHRLNWWNAKPRLNRMGWRWGSVGLFLVIVAGFILEPWVTLFLCTAMCPYVAHRSLTLIRAQIGWTHKVAVSERPLDPRTEAGVIDNIGAIEYDPDTIEVSVDSVKGGRVIRDKRFDTLKPKKAG